MHGKIKMSKRTRTDPKSTGSSWLRGRSAPDSAGCSRGEANAAAGILGRRLKGRGLADLSHTALMRLAILVAILAALVWSYLPTLSDLVVFWQNNSDYSAGALVPLVAAYVVWADRRRLGAMPAGTSWEGIIVLLAAQSLCFYGLLYMYGSLERLSFLLTIVGICLLIVGRSVTWRVAPVLLFLLLMFPLPNRVHNTVSLPLQNFASVSAVAGLEMLGYLVTQEGNILRLSDQTTVAVAEACSGLRMLTAFVIVAASLAFVVNRPRWQKVVVVASSIPVAILANTMRLIVTVLLFEYVGSETGEKFFHDFAGLMMIPFAWATLMAELWLLRWMTGDATSNKVGSKSLSKKGRLAGKPVKDSVLPVASNSRPSFGKVAVICVLVLVIVAGVGHRLLAGRIDLAMGQSVDLRQPLTNLPMQIGDWQGQDVPLDENVRRVAGDDDSVNRQYVNQKTGRSIGVYVGYMGRPRSRMGHRPDVCYPAHGFEKQSSRLVSIGTAKHAEVPAVLYEFAAPQLGGLRDLVLATYIINGRYVNDVDVANDYNTRTIGLVEQPKAYVARIQLSIRATGDTEADMAALSSLSQELCYGAMTMMPIMELHL